MKIGIVCPYDLTLGGGVQEHVLAQAAELTKRGHEIKIITPKPRKLSGNVPDNVIFLGNSRTVKAANTRPQLAISTVRDKVDDMLADEDFDLLHVHEPELPMIGAQIITKAQCPVVATFHAFHPETAMGKTIETFRIPYFKYIFSRLNILTAVSDAAAQFVRERTDQQVHIIPNGIDLAKYQLKRLTTDAPTILYIGRLEKRKGVRYLVKAFAELKRTHTNARLVIAGEGDLRSGLEQYVADNAITDVEFLGFVSEQQKLELLASADVFCAPAIYGESFGIVLLEAMAAGVPIVAGDNPGYTTVLSGHGKISLVNPKDTPDFTRRLDIFLSDTELRQLWLNWASQHVQQFAYNKIVDKYEELYKQL
jgi:phosphatidyl-myo-inositol alpha-mannosyltransferase